MAARLKRTAIFGAVAALSGLLVAPVLTLLAWKTWDWFEAATGIESLGHSGPAEWCYLVAYGAYVAAGIAASFVRPPADSR